MEELLEVLRVQRHNFLNHLQVISGLLQLKKYDRVSEYIRNIGDEYNQASMLGRIESPEIISAILIEELAAGKLGISIDKEINTCMDRGIRSVDATVQTLREIISASACLIASSNCERTIKLKVEEAGDRYCFQVRFTCPDDKDRIERIGIIKEKVEKIIDNIKIDCTDDDVIVSFIS